jgi:hypothetical protein
LDWENGCISTLWIPYPDTFQTTENDACLLEPVHNFVTQDGRLILVVNSSFEDAQVFGLFAPLPASGTVSIDTFLRTLQAGEIWLGIFAEPDIESQGMVIVIPPGNVTERPLVQKRMPGQMELQRTAELSSDAPLYNVVFELMNGVVTTRVARDSLFNAVAVGSGQPWLFIGYQTLPGNDRIDAEFLNLVVEAQ